MSLDNLERAKRNAKIAYHALADVMACWDEYDNEKRYEQLAKASAYCEIAIEFLKSEE